MGGSGMEIKYGDGLEFTDREYEQKKAESSKAVNKPDALGQIIRAVFRAPVDNSSGVSLTIGSQEYGVFNLGSCGVGIYLEFLNDLRVNQQLKGMTINFSGKKFRVDGLVEHISKDAAHILCGIKLTAIDSACEQELLKHLQTYKDALFSQEIK
jgi:hypothetical protein